MGAELFHADKRTDGQVEMTQLIVAFQSFPSCLKLHLLFPVPFQIRLYWQLVNFFFVFSILFSPRIEQKVENIKKTLSRIHSLCLFRITPFAFQQLFMALSHAIQIHAISLKFASLQCNCTT